MKKILIMLLVCLMVVSMAACAQMRDPMAFEQPMDIPTITNQASVLMVIIGALVVLTHLIVEVLKKFTWDKIPTNFLVVCIAIPLTVTAFYAWAAWAGITVLWYYTAGAVVVGFAVAYAAMFGFDKLREALQKIKG